MYKKTGIKLVEDLIGNFSFVLFDNNKNKLFAIRDQIGVKTLFWTKRENKIILASDLFLLNDHLSRGALDREYFAEFYQRNGVIDTERTPYKEVFRLPSGSFLELNNFKNARVHQYWDLANTNNSIIYKDEYDYFEHFRELLELSTRDRLKTEPTNSIMLSGGLDSTSIYAIAKGLEQNGEYKIKPVSAIFEELKEADEREFIDKLLEKYMDKGIYINMDDNLMFEKFPYSIPFSDEPSVNSISFNFTHQLVKESVKNGFDNILSGYAGDHLLAGSLHVTRDLLRKGQISQALSYVTNYSIVTNTSAFDNLINYTLSSNLPKQFVSDRRSSYYISLAKKFKKIRNTSQQELYYQITNAKSHLYTDRFIGGLTGSDIQHPFLDRRLIEFMFNIPGHLRFSGENTKYILRKSMENHLTQEITNRINKTTHLAYTYKSIRSNWDDIYHFMKDSILAEEFKLISANHWRGDLDRWRNGVKVSDYFWTIFSLELWLRKYYKLEISC